MACRATHVPSPQNYQILATLLTCHNVITYDPKRFAISSSQRKNKMKTRASRSLMVGLAALVAASSQAALTTYSQDFESLNLSSPTALGDNGWKIFANVFDNSSNYLYGYGVFPAPNGGSGFSSIATGEGGAAQGSQYLNGFSDYNNTDHGNNRFIEANVFQEQTISAADLGKVATFTFDYKASSQFGPAGSASALAFIKVLDSTNFSLLAFPTLVTTTASGSNWATGSVSLTIDNAWTGQILQFGFLNRATNYDPTGVYYDNINFEAVPEPATLSLLALAAIAARRRRK